MTSAALISPVSPISPKDGHSLAVQSDVHALLDNGLSLGVISFVYHDSYHPASRDWETRYIRARKGSFASRFLRGIRGKIPPSAERLYTSEAYLEVRRTLREWQPGIVVIDDLSVGGFIPTVREILPRAKVVLRSHNVMQDVRREQLRRTSGVMKTPIAFDGAKYTEFEGQVVTLCDRHWAITPTDAARMTELYGFACESLSVSVNSDAYRDLRLDASKRNEFVHVGTIDFRRRSDLKTFLEASWSRILREEPDASLTLAGNLHGRPIKAPHVNYLGKVHNDAVVYSRGRFAVNFQSTTGGVKLKTLTSMAAGRVLVSSPQGVEGLPVRANTHYCDLNSVLETGYIGRLISDVNLATRIADAGKRYIQEHHSRGAIAKEMQRLLNAT